MARDLKCKVYVGDLGYGATKEELEEKFSKYGPLRSVWVARKPPGFAFVEFEDSRDASDAVRALDGARINGGRVRVELSSGKRRSDRRSPPRRPSGGFGGGPRGGRGSPVYDDYRMPRRSSLRQHQRLLLPRFSEPTTTPPLTHPATSGGRQQPYEQEPIPQTPAQAKLFGFSRPQTPQSQQELKRGPGEDSVDGHSAVWTACCLLMRPCIQCGGVVPWQGCRHTEIIPETWKNQHTRV